VRIKVGKSFLGEREAKVWSSPSDAYRIEFGEYKLVEGILSPIGLSVAGRVVECKYHAYAPHGKRRTPYVLIEVNEIRQSYSMVKNVEGMSTPLVWLKFRGSFGEYRSKI